jgi:hypothetical protein
MPSSRVIASAIALFAFIAVFFSASTEATALTYNVAAHEKACFYSWADVPGKKVAFYFAVSFIFLTFMTHLQRQIPSSTRAILAGL